MTEIDRAFIERVEKAHFRSVADTGAHPNAMLVWNMVRQHVGLDRIEKEDLPKYCTTHDTYHRIREDYGCRAGTDMSFSKLIDPTAAEAERTA